MTATGRPCPHRPCPGTVLATGFCDVCGRRPTTAPVAPAQPSSRAPESRKAPAPPPPPRTSPAHPASRAPEPPTSPAPPPPSRTPRPRTGLARLPAAPTSERGPEQPRAQEPPGGTPRPAGAPYRAALDVDGLVLLPDIPQPALADAVRTTARPPDGGRRCGADRCPGVIGVFLDGSPAPDQGFCPVCGRAYSFRPQLVPDDVVAGQYRVRGYLAPGGTGWVYLAEDTELPDLRVVLKALINTGDAAAGRRAVEERRSLTTLHHPDIVRIIASKQHRNEGESEPTDYIVMEYVAGRPLDQLLLAPDDELAALFGGKFTVDHVVTYGCKILGALGYLHEQGLLYCDMKPENVIHYGREIKVIDLGAVRRIDDRGSPLVYTRQYAPKKTERDERGFRVDSDLFTVGRTLAALAGRAEPPAGLAARSFERLIGRATHDEPAARFTSAAQMSRQLWEVLREHRALAHGEPYPERSTRFEPTAVLLGAELGRAPSLAHWTRREQAAPPDLAVEPPGPQEAARALPGPIADEEDPAAMRLGGLAFGVPGRIAERVRDDPDLRTVEVALWLCRTYLLRSATGPEGDPDRAEAERWLAAATRLMGPDVAGYDWRPSWHRGLLYLMRGRIAQAQGEFMAVWATVPGEWAPKLALGYCSEALGGPARETEEFYRAVWERDRTQGSAAFGLARLRLRQGDREGAVRVLDQVPSASRHYDEARVAALRVLTGRLAGEAPPPAALRAASERPTPLPPGEARDRLIAEIRENVLAGHPEPPVRSRGRPRRARANPAGEPDFAPLPPGDLFEGAATRRKLAELLYGSLDRLAGLAPPAERGDLRDRAYAARPETRF